MAVNKFLQRANARKQDEFYTQLSDIENELQHYRGHFKDKVVYLNCDDPTVSNFFVYFSRNFKELGLKQLMATCYKNQNRDMFSTHDQARAIYLQYNGTRNETGIPDDDEVITRPLDGDGDFRSGECIELLKQADIVVTNPPFSLFREYVVHLMEHGKDFLILGSQNAISYKEIFPLLKDNKIWLGVNNGGVKWFEVSPDYEILSANRQKWEGGKKYFSMGSVNWFTNLDHHKRHEEMILYRKYSPDEYPTYDNYDAIEVSRYANIPTDYDGEMGVPITFLDKHNPDQFQIVGMDRPLITELTGKQSRFKIDDVEKYARIVIKKV